MISIKIGNEEQPIESADAQWINQRINQRRAAGQDVCVRVRIQNDRVHLGLATPTCASVGGGGGAPLNAKEQQVVDLWRKRGLSNRDFTGGNLVAFLRQLKNLI